ncbi:MAG: OmpA family protein [Terriglobia bacterium]
MHSNQCFALVLTLATTALLASSPSATTQTPTPVTQPAHLQAIEVTEAGGQILSFRHLAGTTVVEMQGTKIEPQASTRLKVESRRGFIEIDINRGDIKGLPPARRFGRDFLTYVLWAVSADGAAMNLGEITFERGRPVSINVTAPYQTFWLMVTAEPDFAVQDPSSVVVLYSINQDNIDTGNKALPVPGKLLYYTYYTRYDTAPAAVVLNVPNELLQARKAVELASAAGILAAPTPESAEPLPDEARTRQTLEQARGYLQQAEETFGSGGNTRDAIQSARTAAQIAENARALALGAVGGIYIRQLDRELNKLRAEADQLRQAVARLTTATAPLREEADRLRRAHQETQAQLADAQRELANAQRELASLRDQLQQLEAALDQERRTGQQAHARAQETEEQLRALQQQLGSREQSLQQASAQNARLREERDKICAELRRQLASLGQLTQQGGSMALTLASDILFDFGSYVLRSTARENLGRLAVLRLLLFPQADVRYEGHTDLVGEKDYNQWLSEQRALAVYRYFLEEALQHDTAPAARAADLQRLASVQRLLAQNYAAARRNPTQRLELLAQLADSIIGKGEREPVVNSPAAEEHNRRVVLLFPPAKVGRLSSLCESSPAGPGQQE